MSAVYNNSDPLDNDSMDPNDPNSIMYDPTLAEKNATVIVGPKGEVIVVPPDKTSKEDDSQDVQGIQNASDEDVKTDVGKKLRKFGRTQV